MHPSIATLREAARALAPDDMRRIHAEDALATAELHASLMESAILQAEVVLATGEDPLIAQPITRGP